MHCGYVVMVEKLRKHPNADRLQVATFFGNDTCVGLDVEYGEVGVYFPSDIQLSEAFCDANHLCRTKADGAADTGYLERRTRHVKAINLRGEKSDGIYLPIKCLEFTGINPFSFKVGDTITVVNGIEICGKYIPKSNKRIRENCTWCKSKKKVPIAPMFAEHTDTEQLAYNLSAFKPGDQIEISLKLHGTSQRTAHLPVLKGYKRTIWDRLFRKQGTPIYEYDYISGTRRTVLENYEGGFYGNNRFRQRHHDAFVGKLAKGETAYYEVVGFTDTGASIMGKGHNAKLGKDFVKQYGEETVFSYNCHPEGRVNIEFKGLPCTLETDDGTITSNHVTAGIAVPQSDIYVYRMTATLPDGEVIEYTPDFMRYRCEQMGVKCVPAFYKGYIPNKHYAAPSEEDLENGYLNGGELPVGEWVKEKAEQFYDGPDPIGKTHIREGVVVRIVNRPTFKAYKSKNHNFKVLEGLIKDTADAPDMEEAEEEFKEEV